MDNITKDTPIITGTYVQAKIIPSDVDHTLAPPGRHRADAMSPPLDRPIYDIILPLKN